MSNPLVSVIIPCYNVETTIGECVESVLNQTYTNLECLVIDDGSQDKTWSVLQDFTRDKRVRLFSHAGHRNLGVSATRNLGIDESHGEFLSFLDGDDVWLPHKLHRQVDTMFSKHDIGLVFSDVFFCENPDPSKPMIEQPLKLNEAFSCIGEYFRGEPGSTAEKLLFEPRERKMFNWVHSPTPLVRREYFERGLRFIGPPRLTVQFEDYLMWLILSFQCEFLALPEPLAIYRIHSAQFVTKFHQVGDYTKYWIGTEQIVDCLLETCAGEIHNRGLHDRIIERFTNMVLQSVENADAQIMRYLVGVAFRRGFLAHFLRAYSVRTTHRFHYYIRGTQLFKAIHPYLKRLKHILHS